MPFVVALTAIASPRIGLLLVAASTALLGRAFSDGVVPLVGFLVLPWTTLWFALLWSTGEQVAALEWAVVALALAADLVSWRKLAGL